MTPQSKAPAGRRAKPFARAVPREATGLSERKQALVRDALAAAAERLFVSRGFERTTVEQIARAAGVSRRTFFRYFESKEDVLAAHADRLGEQLYAELAARPAGEPPLVAIRNALVPAVAAGVEQGDVLRCIIRLLRETNSLRRVVLARRNRMEERVAALMKRRLGVRASDHTPMLLAFLTRALLDTAFNAWYDHETPNVAALVDDLLAKLSRAVAASAGRGARAGRARMAARPEARERWK